MNDFRFWCRDMQSNLLWQDQTLSMALTLNDGILDWHEVVRCVACT